MAERALRGAVASWFVVTLVGQWLFAYYVVAVYGASTVSGHFEEWTRKPLFRGYVPGDSVGNLSFAAHVLFAIVVAFGGVVQLVPQIRDRAIAMHRWNGRAFLIAAAVVGGGGIYMVWVRHASFHLVNSVAVSFNAVLVLIFATMTWRAARVHDVASHRRWGLRTFMVANGAGVFIRVGHAGWSTLTGGLGTRGDATGPMNYFFEFASYLLPLVILELYLRARSPKGRFVVAVVVLAFTAYLAIGTYAATTSRIHLV